MISLFTVTGIWVPIETPCSARVPGAPASLATVLSRTQYGACTVRMSLPASNRCVATHAGTCGKLRAGQVASLRNPRCEDRTAHGMLQDGFVQVVPTRLARLVLAVAPRAGEDPLPRPVPAGGGELRRQRAGELDPPGPAREVASVLARRTRAF